jgi:glycosyltransferase involved in cell wall biosynthesis
MPQDVLISVVSPVYKAVDTLDMLVSQLEMALSEFTDNKYEIVLVDDGSPDNSWKKIEELCKKSKKIIGLKLSRNFGQHNAIIAGLDACKGEWIVVMDCDLQDSPSEIKKLYNKIQEGYDVVLAKRVARQDSYMKRLSSKLFYFVLGFLTDTNLDESVANFGIYSRRLVNNILRLKEKTRWLPLNVIWAGFSSAKVEVTHSKRFSGDSTYSFRKMLRIAINVILTFSDKPLKLTIKFGLLISFFSLLYGFYLVIHSYYVAIPVEGWLSLIVTVWFLFGVTMIVLGVMGLYIGRILEETKDRPLYIIEEKI